MKFALTVLILLAIGGLGFSNFGIPCTPLDDGEDIDVEHLPEATVTLLGSFRSFRRVEGPNGLPIERIDNTHPLRLTICLPDHHQVSLVVRSMFHINEHGKIMHVFMRRPLKPVQFSEAVADLRSTMEHLGIEPDQKSRDLMATWPDELPYSHPGGFPLSYGLSTHAFEGIDFGVEFKPDPSGGWYYLMSLGGTWEAVQTTLAANRLVTLPEKSPYEVRFREEGPGGPVQGSPLHEVPITLLGSIGDVEAIEPHRATLEILLDTLDVLRPVRLALILPNGRSGEVDVRAMSFLTHYGVIEEVYLRRPMEPVAYKEAIADLERTLERFGIEPDERMRKEMEAWPGDEPETGDGGVPVEVEAETSVSESVNLKVRVGNDPKGGWFSILLFEATDEAKQAAQNAAGTKDAEPAGTAEP